MKTLIITNSFDATTDLLIHNIGSRYVFRLNYDQWDKYTFFFSKDSFSIKSEFHSISYEEVTKVYWRKPFLFDFETDNKKINNYMNAEIKYIFREIFFLFQQENKAILVNPVANYRLGKLTQLKQARKYFPIPEWNVFWNTKTNITSPLVSKSFTSLPFDDNSVSFTRKIEYSEISNNFPWFIQNQVNASHDLTVVYIAGKIFAYTLNRSNIDSVDWRTHQAIGENLPWKPYKLKVQDNKNIINFMQKCNLQFGRLDFLLSENKLVFLEVNVNGQWAWLDVHNENGLMKEMINQVSPLSDAYTYAQNN